MRRHPRRLTAWCLRSRCRAIGRAFVAVVAFAAGGAFTASCSGPGSVTNPTPTPPPSSAPARVYWGALVKGETYGLADPPWEMRSLDVFESHANKRVSILHWGQPWSWTTSWPYGYYPFVPSLLTAVRERGAIPLVDWGSWDLSAGGSADQPKFALSAIIRGDHDDYIRKWATAARDWGHSFFLRFDWEMNGTWFPWSEARNGNQTGEFARAWRHVRELFVDVGATNVNFVWCPNAVYSGGLPLEGLYPGDAYVEWTCVDAYNWGTHPARPDRWVSFRDMLGPTYDQLVRIAPGKSIMIAETSSSESGGSKADWIRDALTVALPQNLPLVKALVWFNWNADGMDWVIESSATTQQAFADSIALPYYAANEFGALEGGLIRPPAPSSGGSQSTASR